MNEKKKSTLPITKTQIEICDFLLANNGIEQTYLELNKKKYLDSDVGISERYFIDCKLVLSMHPLLLSDIGARYANKGIVKFIRDKRRNDFIKSPSGKILLVIIPILLVYTLNCIRTYTPEGISPKNSDSDNIPELLFEQNLKTDSNNRELKPVPNIVKDSIKEINHNK